MKTLYAHYGNTDGARKLGQLTKAMELFSPSRNNIAHRKCIGRLISEPERLVFLSAKHVKGQLGQFEMLMVHHSEMIASAKFARHAATVVHRLIDAIETGGKDGSNSAA